MRLCIIGLNHNSADVSIREKFSVSEESLGEAYSNLLASGIDEAVILSTCNRVEYYIVSDDDIPIEAFIQNIANSQRISSDELKKHLYIITGTEAAQHSAAVASGVDSLVLGEPQILGQVKTAFRQAREHGAIKSYLNLLEQFVLNTAKKVRTDTGIAENAVSVSYAAVDLAKKIFGNLNGSKAMIIGAGEMCELAAEHLAAAGVSDIMVTNRTFAKAETLAQRFHGTAIPFEKFHEQLQYADVIISSTGAPNAIVTKEMVAEAIKKRRNAPMFFIDIAIPRDIEPNVADIPNVYLYDIDDLHAVVDANKQERKHEAAKAKEIIANAAKQFDKKIAAREVDPIIKKVREHSITTAQAELAKNIHKYSIDSEQAELLTQVINSTINKLLHTPITQLKALGADDKQYTLQEATEILFDIKEKESE